MDSSVLVKIGLAVSILALVTCIISISIPFWVVREETTLGVKTEFHQGLWTECAKVTILGVSSKSCVDMHSPASWINTTRGLQMFGLFLIFFGVVILLIHFLRMPDVEAFQMIASFLVCTAGIFVLMAALVYGSKYEETIQRKPFSYHAGFGLAMTTSVLCFIAAVVLVIWRLF